MISKRTVSRKYIESYIKKNWDKLPARTIADKFNMSHDTVLRWARALGLKDKSKSKIYTVNELKEKQDIQEDRKNDKKIVKELVAENKKLNQLLKVKQRVDDEQYNYNITYKKSKGDTEATAFVLASDWHLEQRVEKNKNLFNNEYNLEIAEERAKQFFQNVVKLLEKEQKNTRIDTLVLWLGGDFITGNIHLENLKVCQLGVSQATVFATNILRSGIKYILDNTDVKLIIPYNHGNHARITEKVWLSTEEDNSLEYIIYDNLQVTFDCPRVKFVPPNGSTSMVEVYGLKIFFAHGHHGLTYQGGIGGLYIPARKYIARKFGKINNFYMLCIGHWHQYVQDTQFICNGSMIGYDQYADSRGLEPDIPKQTFFLLDKKRRCRTVTTPITFDI